MQVVCTDVGAAVSVVQFFVKEVSSIESDHVALSSIPRLRVLLNLLLTGAFLFRFVSIIWTSVRSGGP